MDVDLSPSGPPDTVLPDPDADVARALATAGMDASALAGVVAAWPASLEAWAALGESAEPETVEVPGAVEAYAYFRVGYHRGLDLLRRSGWKGSGFVRWDHPSNRGFLRCLDGLRRMAGAIGEAEEEQRTAEFLRMLDPRWDDRST
jgi:Protein of unknown function (DUF3151)